MERAGHEGLDHRGFRQRDLDRQSTRDIVLKGLRGELAAMADWADWLGRHTGDDWVSEVLTPNSSIVSARPPRTKWDEMKLQALCRLNPRAIGLGNKASIVTWFLDYQIEPMKKQGFKGQQKGYARVVAGLGSLTLAAGALGQPWTAGAHAWLQGWFRDPPACKATSLSDALEMTYVP